MSKEEKEIAFEFLQTEKLSITVGSIIRCEKFVCGISYPDQHTEIFVGYHSENSYKAHLREGFKRKIAIDAYDKTRDEALFLVLSMEMVEVIFPEDVGGERKCLGVNIKCIRLESNNKLFHNSERIFFTMYHPMSSISVEEDEIEIIGKVKLPIYWNEEIKDSDIVEKPF